MLGKLPILLYYTLIFLLFDSCQRKDSNLSLPRTSVQCITNYATLAICIFGDSWNRTSVAMMQTPRNAIILYPLHYILYLYTYKSKTLYKYETGKMRFELTDRDYLYGRIAIDFLK